MPGLDIVCLTFTAFLLLFFHVVAEDEVTTNMKKVLCMFCGTKNTIAIDGAVVHTATEAILQTISLDKKECISGVIKGIELGLSADCILFEPFFSKGDFLSMATDFVLESTIRPYTWPVTFLHQADSHKFQQLTSILLTLRLWWLGSSGIWVVSRVACQRNIFTIAV